MPTQPTAPLLTIVYNLLIAPLLMLAVHLAAPFSSKVRKGLAGRYHSAAQVRQFLSENPGNRPLFLIHCASMGEFEHIRPILRGIKSKNPESKTVVMFFSPSGFRNVKNSPSVDLVISSPFDFWFAVRRLFRKLNPAVLIIAKYDLWPNQIWVANHLGIPAVLVNGTLGDNSGRLRSGGRWFQRKIHSGLQKILVVSEEDRRQYIRLSGPEKVAVAGDSKYDQVIFRAEESRRKAIIPEAVSRGKTVFLAGSSWPEDEAVFLPVLRKLLAANPDFMAIICPHEPTESHLLQLEAALKDIAAIRLSDIANYRDQPVIIIDRIGVLANLYAIADIAFVGGGFKQNVHNVLEPAVYGIPVMFGPINQRSHEAQLLKQVGGGFEVLSSAEIERHLGDWLDSPERRGAAGAAAISLVDRHRGSSERILEYIMEAAGDAIINNQ